MVSRKFGVSSFVLLAVVIGCASGCATQQEEETPPEVHSEAVGQVQSKWDIDSPTDETKATHLFIVNRALDLLEHPDAKANPRVERLRSLMTNPSTVCHAAWHRGLYDADYLKEYIGGDKDLTPESSEWEILNSGATWASHFYDPDTQKNYKGNSDWTARTQASKMLARAKAGLGDDETVCYNIGVALHYFTDITEPMHASNFTATTLPFRLHNHIEHYAQHIQAEQKYPMMSRPYSTTRSPDSILVDTAKITKPRWNELYTAVGKTYRERDWCFWDATTIDNEKCWEGADRVRSLIFRDLDAARQFTAEYLYAVGNELEGL